jgi:hypothetical protein
MQLNIFFSNSNKLFNIFYRLFLKVPPKLFTAKFEEF